VVCAAGPLDPQKGILLTPPSLPAWRNVPVKQYLKEAFGIPVWVENDADLAALGEQRFGAGKGCSRLIYITVSTGIGGGVIVDNRILRGTDLSVAEIGHIVVDPNGPVCNCGGIGHLETLASGTAIGRIATERIANGETGSLSSISGSSSSPLTGQAVVEAALQGDALALDVIGFAGKYLGMAVASLMHLFDPEVVIIGGGISNAGELILEPARQSMNVCSMTDFKGRTRLVRSELGDDSGIMGAIALALEKIESS
jgi:glucokinase